MTELHQSKLHQEPSAKPSTWSSRRAAAPVLGTALIAILGCTTPLANAQAASVPGPATNAVVDVAPVPAKSEQASSAPDRSTAYYHAALADSYEDMAINYGRQDYFSKAIEEYKLALNADPNSSQLAVGFAELYLRAGRIPDAIQTAKTLLKKDDNNIEAHKLLGRIYLRSLGQQQNSGSESTPSNQVLDLAIAEFAKIVSLEPKSIEDRLLLGQLYTVKHDNAKAEAQFKAAQGIEPASEDAILSLARLYADSGDLKRATDLLEALPVDDRTTKEEFALGAAYEQLKDLKKAIAAYQRSVDI